MAQSEIFNLLNAANSESLVDSIFFGQGGTQWFEQTILYQQYTHRADECNADLSNPPGQRLYTRKYNKEKVNQKKPRIKSRIKRNTSCVTNDYQILSNTEISASVKNEKLCAKLMSKLSLTAPEFIPMYERLPLQCHNGPTTAENNCGEGYDSEYHQILSFHNASKVYPSDSSYYSEQSSYIFQSQVMEHQYEPEIYFNVSTLSNDSGIASEDVHSPVSPSEFTHRSPRIFQARSAQRFHKSGFKIINQKDYDKSFPPIHRYDEKTRTIQLDEYYEVDLKQTQSHSKAKCKYLEKKPNNGENDTYSTPKRNNPTKRSCIYCKRLGKDESMFDSHCLRYPISGKLMCPALVNNVCEHCGDTNDDNVHTTRECRTAQTQSGFKNFNPC